MTPRKPSRAAAKKAVLDPALVSAPDLFALANEPTGTVFALANEPTGTVFALANEPPRHSGSTRWLFVTNQRNLFYMLAAGLIMPPSGFGKKYYRDTLECFPGWIPLFLDAVPKAAIGSSISERNHLIPCIATLDLDALQGQVIAVSADGAHKEISFPQGLDGTEQFLLIPAPLPIYWLSSIRFQSPDDMANCGADARDFANVPLTDFSRIVCADNFNQATEAPWPVSISEISVRKVDLAAPIAAGAIMAMLMRLAHYGELAKRTCQLSFDNVDSVAKLIKDPLLAALGGWMNTGKSLEVADIPSVLFWGLVDKVAANRFSDAPVSALDVVLEHLESQAERLGERMRQALTKLAADMRTMVGFSDSTVTEIFERHPKTFSRVIALFLLRDKCADLLEFKHALLTETDYIAAAILFAAREGWLGLPLSLRGALSLQVACSHRMAAMAHHIAVTGLALGPAPPWSRPQATPVSMPEPVSLSALFEPGPRGWSAAQKSAAICLARECKWNCIQTRVNLGKGDYRLVIGGGGLQILLDGEVKAVETEVEPGKFFAALADLSISDKLDRKTRELLKA